MASAKPLFEIRNHPAYEAAPAGIYHDFWLVREDEYRYEETDAFWGRKGAPIQMSDDLIRFFVMSLSWVRTTGSALDYGLNFYGPTIINSLGAVAWAQSMRGWAQVFASGPEVLRLYSGLIYNPYERDDDEDVGPYNHFLLVDRDTFVADIQLLAEWGDKAATGEYFILHLGI